MRSRPFIDARAVAIPLLAAFVVCSMPALAAHRPMPNIVNQSSKKKIKKKTIPGMSATAQNSGAANSGSVRKRKPSPAPH